MPWPTATVATRAGAFSNVRIASRRRLGRRYCFVDRAGELMRQRSFTEVERQLAAHAGVLLDLTTPVDEVSRKRLNPLTAFELSSFAA
jgi:hypothetical protein